MAIGNQLVFDVNGNVEDFIFILSTKDFRHLGAIQNVIPESVHHPGSLASADEISFEVYKTVKKEIDEEFKEVEEPLWDEITNLKLVYVRELDEYFEMSVQLDDTTEVVKKTVTCTSLCEAELGQIYIRGLEVNSEADIARDDYEPTIFCNDENPNASFIHRLFSFAPHYTIMHVDESLKKLQRTFSVDEAVFYDWLTGECAKEFNCLFQFDTTTRGVYVYDLCTVCKDCGYRAEYIDECPECGSTNLDYFGEDTTIYIDKENLTDAVQLTTEVGAIKNCFYLETGDDVLTAIVRMLNMNGTGYLFLPTDDQLAEMPEELRNKIVSYNELYLSKQDEYEGIVADIFEAQSKIDYYTHTMMPTIEHAEVTAQTEADKLTVINLSPLGLSSMTESTSKSTVESALKNYAKVYVKTGYVKLDVEQSNYTFIGKGHDGYNHGKWTGNFKVTNWSDSEDIAYSEVITIDVTDNYQEFLEQRIMKNIVSNSDEENSVFDVLSISELDDFTEALKLYGLKRLQSFYDAIQSALDVLLEVDQANESADFYEPLYLPYYKKLQACQSEIDARQITIDEWQHTKDNLELQQHEIQADLNLQDYLGEELYETFCMYKREDTYRNENYISDGLSDSEQIRKAKDFIDIAKKELEKARTPKLSISTTLYNLLLMPEFKPIIHHFKLGNWLRICVDGVIYRLRLIGYDLSFSSIQTLSVEFANVTKLNTVGYETKEILDSAKSMASNFDYFVAQAKKGNEANVEITRWLEYGLNSSLMNVKNNNNEEIVTDKHGIIARTFNDLTGNYEPEQLRITHNIIAMTEDNWLTSSLGLGKHTYTYFDGKKFTTATGYGISSKFSQHSYIYGGQIVGSDIYSENYKVDANGNVIQGSHLALKTGGFALGAGKLTYDPIRNKMTIKGVDIEWSSSTTPEISDINGLTEDLAQKSASITANSNAITAEVKRASEAEGNLSSKIEQTAESITSTVNKEISDTKTYVDGKIEETNTLLSSKIEQTAESITSTVSKTYVTNTSMKESVDNLQQQIDGAIETFTGNEVPTLINYPANEWETNEVKDTHIGDLYVVNSSGGNYAGFYYRFEKSGSTYQWTLLKDSEVTKALQDAKEANDKANAVADDLNTNYSTTTEMNTAIQQKADSITSSVSKQITETKTYAETVAGNAQNNANNSTDEKLKAYSTTVEMQSQIKQTADSINSEVSKKVGTDQVVSTINQSAEEVKINAQKISLEGLITNNNGFEVDENGYVKMKGANISGVINATKGGTIASFNIGDNAIYNGTSSLTSTTTGIYLGTDGIRQYKSDDAYVNISNGILESNGAKIKGNIEATEGTIANWKILSGFLYNDILIGVDKSCGISCGSSRGGSDDFIFWAGNDKFRVDINGNMYAKQGQIGSWTLTSTDLYHADENNGAGIGINGTTFAFWAGSNYNDRNSAPFRVGHDGNLTATNANIEGILKAGKGSSLGTWSVDGNSIYSGTWGSSTPKAFMCTGTTGSYSLGGSESRTGWVFGAGSNFGVTNDGKLYASAGKIGGWIVANDCLWGTDSNNNSVVLRPNSITAFDSKKNISRTLTWSTLITEIFKLIS